MGIAVSGAIFILANTVLDNRFGLRLGTAWGAAKNLLDEFLSLSNQLGSADARMTITDPSSRLFVLMFSCNLFLINRGCFLKGVRKRRRPLSIWNGAAKVDLSWTWMLPLV